MFLKKIKNIAFYIFLFLFCLAFGLHRNIPDLDLWARLLQGKAFWQLGHILKQDPFSFTPVHNWYDHEWGSSVVFYLFQDKFGAWGLIFLKAILIFLILFFIIQTINLRKLKYTSSAFNFLFWFFTLHAMVNVCMTTVRCHLFSFAFFAMFLYILERVRIKNQNKLLILLPIFMVIWSNMHGGCVAGLGLIILYSIGEFLNKKEYKKYIITSVFTFLAFFINPYGFEYVKFLLMATTMKRPLIEEWVNSFVGVWNKHFLYKFYLIFSIIIALSSFIKSKLDKKNIDYTRYIVLLMTIYLSISHVKLQPFLPIAAAAYFYDDFYCFFNKLVDFTNKILHITNENVKRIFKNTKEIIVYFFITLFIINTIMTFSPVPQIIKHAYPYFAVEFIKKNNIKGKVIAPFGSGSYVIYKLYPDNLVYMDGRYEEVYPNEVFNLLAVFMDGLSGWEYIFTYKPDIFIIPIDSRAYFNMTNRKDFKEAFSCNKFAVFLKNELYREDYKLPTNNYSYYMDTLFDTKVNYLKPPIINGKKVEFK